MGVKISIPYNIFRGKKINIGLDAYFWKQVSKPYRRTLFVRPINKLKGSPEHSTIVLPSRINHSDQLSDLWEIISIVKHEKIKLASKHQRWKLARFFLIPLPSKMGDTSTLTELVYAEQIAKDIVSSNIKFHSIGWLVIEYDEVKSKIFLGKKVDKIYQWLLENDESFRNEFNKIIAGKH